MATKSDKSKRKAAGKPAAAVHRVPDVNDLILGMPGPSTPDGVGKWLENLELAATAFPFYDPAKPGFTELRTARNMARRARIALADNGNIEEATWAGMRSVHLLFTAMLIQGRPLMDAGIPQYRRTEARNLKAAQVAAQWAAEMQVVAAEKWSEPQHARKSKSAIARLIAPQDPKLQRKIREVIVDPSGEK